MCGGAVLPVVRSQVEGRRIAAAVAVLLLAALVLGFAYSGSPDVVADGVTVSGQDVGGLSAAGAQTKLDARAHALATEPVVFTGAGRRWSIAPAQLAVRGDWGAASAAAVGRGTARCRSGASSARSWASAPTSSRPARADGAALERQLRVIAKQVDVDGREAAIVLGNGQPAVIPGEASRKLDAAAAGKAIVAALAALEREGPVALPIKTTPPAGQDALAAVAQQVRIALGSRDPRLQGRAPHGLPEQIASFLELPHDGESEPGSAARMPRNTSTT